METAQKARGGQEAGHGPTDVQVDSAVRTLEDELSTPEFLETLELEETLPLVDQIKASNMHVIENATTEEPRFQAIIRDMTVKVYIDSIGSPNDPYYVSENIDRNNLTIIVNVQHPHWQMLEGENSVVNYLRHCIYDGIAEHRAIRLERVEPDSVKKLKDSYLRVPFELLQSADQHDSAEEK